MFKNIAEKKNKTRPTHRHAKDGRKTVSFVLMWMDSAGGDDDGGYVYNLLKYCLVLTAQSFLT